MTYNEAVPYIVLVAVVLGAIYLRRRRAAQAAPTGSVQVSQPFVDRLKAGLERAEGYVTDASKLSSDMLARLHLDALKKEAEDEFKVVAARVISSAIKAQIPNPFEGLTASLTPPAPVATATHASKPA